MPNLPLPGRIALLAAKEAELNVGVHEEGGNNRGRYVEIYLKAVAASAGDPWCAAFIRYREEAADKQIASDIPKDFPDSAWTPDYKDWAVRKKLWVSRATAQADPAQVKRGDLVLFYFASKGRIAHVGVVVAVHDWGVTTVEGNTGPDAGSGVKRDGDGVYRKARTWAELGSGGGFARLPF